MYIVIIENNGLYLAIVSDNGGIPCESRKEAERLASVWNATYKRNGCLLTA